VAPGRGADLDEFDAFVAGQEEEQHEEPVKLTLKMPKAFKPIVDKGVGRHMVDYLIDKRGFADKEIERLVARYDLRCASSGNWHSRVIIPIFFDGKLVSWTARAIGPATVRYKTLSHNPDKAEETGDPVALYNIKHTIYDFDELFEDGGRTLLITEGPFDAIKVDFYGYSEGLRATCLYGTAITDEQVWLLTSLLERFENTYCMFDPEAWIESERLRSALAMYGIRQLDVPDAVDDPGAMTRQMVRQIVRQLS